MKRIAIPIFKSRISPVLDSCTRILIVDIEENRVIEREEIYVEEFSRSERVKILQRSHVSTVVCGGISHILHNMLHRAKISLITGIAGEAQEVVAAFAAERLHEPRFHMPGYREPG